MKPTTVDQSESFEDISAEPEAAAEEATAAAPATPPIHTLTGNIHYHHQFPSQLLGRSRDLIIYLPPSYETAVDMRYPVLYLHDGQNLFDSATAFGGAEWEVDETAQKLILDGQIEPLIIVGIYNAGEHRIEEYTPTHDPRQKKGGQADLYGRFIVEELKPLIDQRYRTLPGPEYTGLGGSSLGGLATLYLGLKHPRIFSKLVVMSPSVWWDYGVILRLVDALKAKPTTRIWLDVGTKEGKYTPGHVRLLCDKLVAQGWRLNADLRFLLVKGGQHNEKDWGKRIEPALKFLFPRKK